MASLLVMSDAARSAALVSSSAAAPSSCSSSLPIGAAPRRGAPANSLDFSAYLLSASPPGFELSRTAFSCGLPPSQRLSPPNAFQVIAIFIDTLPSACRVCVTVRLSRRSTALAVAGRFTAERPATGDIDRQLQALSSKGAAARRSAANAGSAMLTVEGRS